MLVNDDELKARLDNPNNLLNRLRNLTNPHKKNIIPALPPTADDVIADLDDKIANSTTKSKATNLLNAAMDELHKRLPEVSKPEKLAAIAADMSKVVNNSTLKNPVEENDRSTPQIIIYAPQIVSEEHFKVIDIGET